MSQRSPVRIRDFIRILRALQALARSVLFKIWKSRKLQKQSLDDMLRSLSAESSLSARDRTYLCSILQKRYAIYLSPKAQIGADLKLPHAVGIVIGEGVVLGDRVTVYQNVTLGGKVIGDQRAGNYPTVGDETTIFAGAVIVGRVHVGAKSVIGANSVVLRDVPNDATVAGIPAKIIRNPLL